MPEATDEEVKDPLEVAVQETLAKANAEKELVIKDERNEVVRDGDDHDAFVKQLMESRQAPIPEPPPPPKPTARQWSRTEEEMLAGAKRVAFFKEQALNRPVPEPDPGTGQTTPVFRPEAYFHEKAGKDGPARK